VRHELVLRSMEQVAFTRLGRERWPQVTFLMCGGSGAVGDRCHRDGTSSGMVVMLTHGSGLMPDAPGAQLPGA
jgi:hypothetical protein